jgi:signal transduction histidine kinase
MRAEASLRERPVRLRETDLSFLLDATRLLADSLDIEATLATVARLSLPQFGSWCVVDLHANGQMRRVAIIHPDPDKRPLTDRLLSGWPPERDDPLGIPTVMRTHRSEITAPVTDELLVRAAHSPENLAILRALRIGSLMTIPLLARDQVLGAITYLSPAERDPFSAQDLALAEDLATRCAIAIDNSRLMRDANDARVQAEEANLVKMRFLSSMSHELRTPLNAIAGYAEILELGLRGSLTEGQLADVRRIKANLLHLLGLVESVLSYAKINAGRVEFGCENLSLPSVLLEVQRIIDPLAEDKGLSCVFAPSEPTEVTVYADHEKLRQILVNLVANAIKFTPEGGRIEVTQQLTPTHVEVRVADNGVGIAPENRERIFEPFVQVEGSETNAHEGTGLGLAISRELAVGMGGGLSVESELGRGSTFTLTLARGHS